MIVGDRATKFVVRGFDDWDLEYAAPTATEFDKKRAIRERR